MFDETNYNGQNCAESNQSTTYHNSKFSIITDYEANDRDCQVELEIDS
jgi:hypothetical protein